MVEAGKITLRIEVDLAKFNGDMRQVEARLNSVSGVAVKTGESMEKLGESTITNAVRFQTMTQGAINLTTAFTQTYTSISNLQRAKTSLQAAAVGVERALDLQARKQFQLSEEQKKAIPNIGKMKLLTNELATAHDDLSVKQQRVKDQADAVNDTYVLFALNIANVGFSAIQTGLSMAKMASGFKLAAVGGALLNVAMSKWTFIALAAIAAWEGLSYVIGIFNKDVGDTMSITKNVMKIMKEFEGNSSITLDNYEKKIGNATSATSGFEESWSSMTNTVKKNTSEQKRIVLLWEKEMAKSVNNVKYNLDSPGHGGLTSGGSQGNFPNAQTGNSTKIISSSGQAVLGAFVAVDIWNDLNGKLTSLVRNLFPSMPEASAELMLTSNVTGIIVANKAKNAYINDDNRAEYFRANAGSTSWNQIDPKVKERLYGKEFPSFFGNGTVIDIHKRTALSTDNFTFGKTFNEYNTGVTPAMAWYSKKTNDLKLKISTLESMISMSTEDSPTMGLKKNKLIELTYELMILEMEAEEMAPFNYPGSLTADTSFNSVKTQMFKASSPETSARREAHRKAKQDMLKIKSSPFIYKGDLVTHYEEISGGIRIKENVGRKVAYAGIGGNMLAQGVLDGAFFGHGESRIHGRNIIDTPIMRMLEAAQLEDQRLNGPNVPIGHRTGVDVTSIGFRLSHMGLNVSGNGTGGFSQSAIAAGASASGQIGGASRFASRNRMALQSRAQNIATEDMNRNKLRNGGRWAEGYGIDNLADPSAVIGGYTSLSSYRVAQKEEFRQASIGARGYIGAFGVSTFSSGYEGDANAQNSRYIAQAAVYASTLSEAGISMMQVIYDARSTSGRGWSKPWGSGAVNEAIQQSATAYNQLQLQRASQINILNGGFGLSSYFGSGDSYAALAMEVARQDNLIKQIGLNRSQAFNIIDTDGRGREEIDDRLRWHDRMNAISTGTSPL